MNSLILFDHSGIIQYVSPLIMRSLLGYEPADLIGKSGSTLMFQDDFLRLLARVTENDSCRPTDVDLKLRCKNGDWCSVHGSWAALVGLSETVMLLTCTSAENTYHATVSRDDQSAPLLIVDRLIAQISHDVRNPLATAQEALFLLKSVAPDEGDIGQYLLWLEASLKSIMDTVLNIHNPLPEYLSQTTIGAPTGT